MSRRGAGCIGASEASEKQSFRLVPRMAPSASGAKVSSINSRVRRRSAKQSAARRALFSSSWTLWSVRHCPRDLHSLKGGLTFIARSMLGPEMSGTLNKISVRNWMVGKRKRHELLCFPSARMDTDLLPSSDTTSNTG